LTEIGVPPIDSLHAWGSASHGKSCPVVHERIAANDHQPRLLGEVQELAPIPASVG
jgi:hypothetical protein